MAEVAEFMNNYLWFNKAVARWLNIALFKAMQRVKAAVEKDTLEPVDELVKHSSSAVDIGTVLVQIKTFWKQLDWPDVESCHTFLSKILDVSTFLNLYCLHHHLSLALSLALFFSMAFLSFSSCCFRLASSCLIFSFSIKSLMTVWRWIRLGSNRLTAKNLPKLR